MHVCIQKKIDFADNAAFSYVLSSRTGTGLATGPASRFTSFRSFPKTSAYDHYSLPIISTEFTFFNLENRARAYFLPNFSGWIYV